jgi:hypothetical protein
MMASTHSKWFLVCAFAVAITNPAFGQKLSVLDRGIILEDVTAAASAELDSSAGRIGVGRFFSDSTAKRQSIEPYAAHRVEQLVGRGLVDRDSIIICRAVECHLRGVETLIEFTAPVSLPNGSVSLTVFISREHGGQSSYSRKTYSAQLRRNGLGWKLTAFDLTSVS